MSYKEGDEIHIEDDDAMAATSTGRLRWILGLSLLAACAFMTIAWVTGSFFFDPNPAEPAAQEAPADPDNTMADDAVTTPTDDETVGTDSES